MPRALILLAKTPPCLPPVRLILSGWRRGRIVRQDGIRTNPFVAIGVVAAVNPTSIAASLEQASP